MHSTAAFPIAVMIALAIPATLGAQELPDWASRLRADHPRLFLNADTWPSVRDRALGPEKAWYDSQKGRVDTLLKQLGEAEQPEIKEHGQDAARAAFVYLMTEVY